MPARLTAYLPNAAAWCLLRPGPSIIIGRAPDCGFQVDHPSVSRRHAELAWLAPHWHLRDLESKNGTFVDATRVQAATLGDRVWFRIADIACELVAMTEGEADVATSRLSLRRASSAMMLEGLGRQTSLPDMLQETIRSIVELAGCERGFLLLADKGGVSVAAIHDLDPSTLRDKSFRGSVGAAQRAMEGRQAVVVNESRFDAELAGRRSVIAGGLRTLVCIPLLAGNECIGLAYADSSQPGALITTMDLDLLRAFSERAALWIAARRGLDALAALAPGRAGWAEILDAQQLAPA